MIVAEGDLDDFMVGLTDENPAVTPPVYGEYYHVQYKGKVKSGEKAQVEFAVKSEAIYRYVIIQLKVEPKRAICLKEVVVLAKRK